MPGTTEHMGDRNRFISLRSLRTNHGSQDERSNRAWNPVTIGQRNPKLAADGRTGWDRYSQLRHQPHHCSRINRSTGADLPQTGMDDPGFAEDAEDSKAQTEGLTLGQQGPVSDSVHQGCLNSGRQD